MLQCKGKKSESNSQLAQHNGLTHRGCVSIAKLKNLKAIHNFSLFGANKLKRGVYINDYRLLLGGTLLVKSFFMQYLILVLLGLEFERAGV